MKFELQKLLIRIIIYKIEENYTVFSWLKKLTSFVLFHIRVVLLKSKTTFHQYSAIKFKNPFFRFEPGGTRSQQTPFFCDIRSQGGYFIPLKLENVLEEGLVNKGGDN